MVRHGAALGAREALSYAEVLPPPEFAPHALEADGPSFPGEGGMDLWAFRVDREGPGDRALLSADECARAERILVPAKTIQSVVARAQLRRILGAYLDRDPRTLSFDYGPHDRPELRGRPLRFNLSHSRDWALVAVVEDGEVGVDVEYAGRPRAFEAVASRFFAAPERAYLASLDPAARGPAFFRAWTRKEAYLKAWGTGLSFASSRFCVDYAAGQPGRVLSTEMPGDDPERWHFVDLQIAADYPGAACWDRPAARVRAFRLPELQAD